MPMASARGRERARGGAREEEMGAWTAKKSKGEASGVHIASREAEARGSSTQQCGARSGAWRTRRHFVEHVAGSEVGKVGR